MPGLRLSAVEHKLAARWDSPHGYRHALRAVAVSGDATLRGLRDVVLEFDYPVTVVCGRNGTGKSTVLALAMLAYSDSKRKARRSSNLVPGRRRRRHPLEKLRDFTFSDFFFKGPGDSDVSGISIQWAYADGSNLSIRKQSQKWMRYERRPKRDVVFLGISRCVPAIEQLTLRSRFRKPTRADDRLGALEPQYLNHLSHVLGTTFDSAVVYGDSRYGVRTLSNGRTFSSFNMGAGEDAIVQILYAMQKVAEGSLVGIEEVEIGIHPSALQRLAKVILEIADKKALQVIITSHSEHFIDALPRRGRLMLQRLGSTTVVVPRPTTRMALSDMAAAKHHELSIYVEDNIAEAIVRRSLHDELRSRVEIRPIGSNSAFGEVSRSVRRCLPGHRFLFLFDGDTTWQDARRSLRDADMRIELPVDVPVGFEECKPYNFDEEGHQWMAKLPGPQPPEEWLIVTLSMAVEGPAALAKALGLASGAPKAASILERLRAQHDHHAIPHELESEASLAPNHGPDALMAALGEAAPEIVQRIEDTVSAVVNYEPARVKKTPHRVYELHP